MPRPPSQPIGLADTNIDALADTNIDALADTNIDALADTQMESAPQTRVDSGPAAVKPGGEVRNERYKVLAEHARGGVGRVLRARDRQLERTVAIKEMIQISDLAERLFLREAMVTARLQHPGVVSVIEAGHWPSGDPYYVMNLISGESLLALIGGCQTLDERLTLLPNIIAVVETIAYAHSQGVIHSDIKPGNIIVGDFGETLVVDWGLARERNSAEPTMTHTAPRDPAAVDLQALTTAGGADTETAESRLDENPSLTGRVVGTPAYMAPEQARGHVDERTDVYALGALLYELLSGCPPYSGTPLSVLDKIRREPPRPLTERTSEIPSDLVTIVETAMARNSDQRYASAKELADELRRFQAGQWVSAHRYSLWAMVKRWCARHRAAVGVALAALLVLSILGALSVKSVIHERDRATAEEIRARSAMVAAEQRQNQLLLAQAESALERDPTETIAWLRQLPLTEGFFAKARELFDDATAQGVAEHAFGHDGWVVDIAFTPDGKHLLSASRDGTLRMNDLTSGTQRVLLRGRRSVDTLAVSPDGAWLASNRGDRDALLWPLIAGVPSGEPQVLSGHRERVLTVDFSADSQRLITRAADDTATVWDIGTRTPIAHLRAGAFFAFTPDAERVFVASLTDGSSVLTEVSVDDDRELNRIALPGRALNLDLSPDGVNAAMYGADGRIHLVDTRQGVIETLDQHRVAVTGATFPQRFSPDGRYLVAGEPSNALRVWDLAQTRSFLLRGHTDVVFDFAFSADESLLVSAGDDATVWLWDLESSNARALRGHTDDVMRVAINPAGDRVATASKDGQARVWSIRTDGRRLSGHADIVSGIVMEGPDRLLTSTRNGEIRRWDVRRDTSELVVPARPDATVYRTFVSPHGSHVATFDNRRLTLDLWNLSTDTRHELAGHQFQVYHIAYSADGQWLASTDRRGGALLWSLGGSEPEVRWRGREVCGIAIAPRGDEFVVLQRDRIVYLGLPDLQARATGAPDDLPGTVESCAAITRSYAQYTLDGSRVAIVASPWGLALDERASGSRQWLDIGSHLVNALQFSPDSKLLAAGVHDRSVRVWDLASGAGKTLGAHRDMIMDLAFVPNTQVLASASYDHTIRLWDLKSGRKQVLRSHNASVDRLLPSKNGAWLLSGSRDRTVRMWDLRSMATIPDAQALRSSIASVSSVKVLSTGRIETEVAAPE